MDKYAYCSTCLVCNSSFAQLALFICIIGGQRDLREDKCVNCIIDMLVKAIIPARMTHISSV